MKNLSKVCCVVGLFCFNVKKKLNLKNFNQAQIAGWAEVARDLAQVLFAGLVIEGLNQGEVYIIKTLLGAVGAVILWLTSHKLNAKLKS